MTTARNFIMLLFTASFTCAVFADNLGVLFTTPEQRAALDAGHGTATVGKSTSGPEVVKIQPRTITVNGTLVSSAGNREVWLNGHPSFEGKRGTAGNIRLLGKNRVRLRPEPASTSHVLKPGQVVDLGSGRINEAYSQPPAK